MVGHEAGLESEKREWLGVCTIGGGERIIAIIEDFLGLLMLER